jgi:hypothetical protein
MALTNSVNASSQGYQVLNTSTGAWSGRTFQAGAGISISQGSGVAGDTTITNTGALYSLSPYIVGSDAQSQYSTIQAAITAAVAAGASASNPVNIYIKPGTYNETPTSGIITMSPGINLIGFDPGSVKIVGQMSYSGTGPINISDISLQTNSNYFLSVTGSNASSVSLKRCNFSCSNFTGINFSTSSGSSGLSIDVCTGNIETTGIALYTFTSPGIFNITRTTVTNGGASTTASSMSAGTGSFSYSVFGIPLSFSSSTLMGFSYTNVSTASINSVGVTTSGTSTLQFFQCFLNSGTASSISIGSGTTVSLINSTIISSNANAIAGTGSLAYNGIEFAGTSSTLQNTLSLTLNGFTPANAASGALLASTGANTSPAYTLTPSVTSITLGGGTALSSYVEGTFTPTVVGTTTAGTATYTTQQGRYTKIGRLVFYELSLSWNTGTGAGDLQIAGFPEFSGSIAPNTTSAIYVTNATATATVLYFQMNSGTTSGNLYYYNPSIASTGSVAYASSATVLQVSGSYYV